MIYNDACRVDIRFCIEDIMVQLNAKGYFIHNHYNWLAGDIKRLDIVFSDTDLKFSLDLPPGCSLSTGQFMGKNHQVLGWKAETLSYRIVYEQLSQLLAWALCIKERRTA